jgi:glycosyltransferase involved in cell wall biosynthesis
VDLVGLWHPPALALAEGVILDFLLVSAFSESGNESGANRMRKLAAGIKAHGYQAEWLGPPHGFFLGGALGKISLSLWLLVKCMRWAMPKEKGWILISLPPPWLAPLAACVAIFFPSRLILDFRDPLLNQDINPRPFIFRSVVGFLQKWAVRRARLVVVAAPMIAGHVGAPPGKTATVLGAVAEEEAKRLLGNPVNRNKAVIVYGGTFYGSRSPGALLEALAEYQGELLFEFYVSFNDAAEEAEARKQIARLGLGERVRLAGQIPRREFLERLRRAGGGLVITHSKGSDYAIPGKVFDYLTAGVVPWVISEDKGLLDFLGAYRVNAVVTRGWTKEELLQGLQEFSAATAAATEAGQAEVLASLFEARQISSLLAALEEK